MTDTDSDRLELLDRLADRVPELDLDANKVEWTTLDDGHEALLVNGGGIDGGEGAFFANAGEDLHAVGSLAPLAPAVGCVVIRPDGTRLPRSGYARPAGAAEAVGLEPSLELIPAPWREMIAYAAPCTALSRSLAQRTTRLQQGEP